MEPIDEGTNRDTAMTVAAARKVEEFTRGVLSSDQDVVVLDEQQGIVGGIHRVSVIDSLINAE